MMIVKVVKHMRTKKRLCQENKNLLKELNKLNLHVLKLKKLILIQKEELEWYKRLQNFILNLVSSLNTKGSSVDLSAYYTKLNKN